MAIVALPLPTAFTNPPVQAVRVVMSVPSDLDGITRTTRYFEQILRTYIQNGLLIIQKTDDKNYRLPPNFRLLRALV